MPVLKQCTVCFEENKVYSTLPRKGACKFSHSEVMDTRGVQQQLPAMFEAQKPIAENNLRWKKLTETICYFPATKDRMAFDTYH